jgi:ribosomal-protein-alanine N-acetyltransferase
MRLEHQTKRLILRVATPDAAEGVLRFYQENKEFLEPYEPLRAPKFYTLEFQRANLSFEYNAFVKMKYFRVWIYRQQAPDIPVGSICFSNFLRGTFSSCMIGYKTGQAYLRQGYMKEALSYLLPLVQEEYGFCRIEAYVMPDNTASICLLEQLGFVKEGLLQKFAQINGRRQDHFLYTYFG